MSVHLHPIFACVWLLEIGALVFLWARLPVSMLSVYVWFWTLREALSFTFSCFQIRYDIYLDYVWTTQFILHLLAAIIIIRCLGISWPKSIFGNFLIFCGVLTAMCAMALTNGSVQWVDGAANAWIAILAWAMWSKVRSPLIPGFLILYSGGTLTSWVWALRPAPQPAVWLAEFAVQGAAFSFWIWAVRRREM